MRVLATAGHVDHGKSALVRALTGMEPDRFQAERERGMTIDLGFVWTRLPGPGSEPERTVAFVDVPGHERFIGTMVAGLGPCPAVMFVVSANEGWSRQSEEHLAVVRALAVRDVLLVVTKSDLADPGPAAAAARQHLLHAGVRDPAVVAVSARTGRGMDELRTRLHSFVSALPEPRTQGRVRLWVDRSFGVRGAGTVVTGTLDAGTIAVGDELELGDRRVRVRGLQSLDTPIERAQATARVALNLADVSVAEVGRGSHLLSPGAWHRGDTVDVRLALPGLDDLTRLPEHLDVHLGTHGTRARLRLLGDDVARLVLPGPLAVTAGDRFILRAPGARHVLGGAVVLDADPPALARRGAARRRAEQLSTATGELDLVREVTRRGVLDRAHAARLGLDLAQPLDPDPGGQRPAPQVRSVGEFLVAEQTWAGWVAALPGLVDAQAVRDPLQPSISGESARAGLGLPTIDLVGAVATQAGLELRDGRVQRPGARRSLGAAEAGLAQIEQALQADPCAAPERDQLAAAGLGPRELAAAERDGRVLRLPGDIVLLPGSPARVMRVLAGLPQPFTLSQARQALGSTRRVVVPLLEHLDGRGWTRRVDGTRREVVR